jgi:hypothetical protein
MQHIDNFMKHWPAKNSLKAIGTCFLTEVEVKLSITLPDSYKYLLANYGLLHSPNVMTKTCDLSVDVSQVQDFFNLADVAALSELYQLTGMLDGHIIFAADSFGNMFCFSRAECETASVDVAVFLANSTVSDVKKIAESFTDWLLTFNIN